VILRALGLGDLLTAVPTLRALAEAFPRHERVLAAPAALAPLVELTGTVDRVVEVNELEPLPRELHGAALAVNLHGRGPQSHRVLLAARPRRALWFESDAVPESRGAPKWRAGEHEVDRWCRLLADHGVPADPALLRLDPPAGEPPKVARGATLIHPGAASAARRWPLERFAYVARAERARGRPVVLTGGREEMELCIRVARRAGLAPESVLAGRTDLADLARAVAAASRVVCGDTGVAHLATALGTRSVVLFGPTPPDQWGPRGAGGRHRVLWGGGRGDPHAAEPDPSLLAIEADQVEAALAELP
jgi:ADP-heptose:LPS heptosyltransferase